MYEIKTIAYESYDISSQRIPYRNGKIHNKFLTGTFQGLYVCC